MILKRREKEDMIEDKRGVDCPRNDRDSIEEFGDTRV